MPRALEDERQVPEAGSQSKKIRASPYPNSPGMYGARHRRGQLADDRQELTEAAGMREPEALQSSDEGSKSRGGTRVYHPRATIVLIGMRGVGKVSGIVVRMEEVVKHSERKAEHMDTGIAGGA